MASRLQALHADREMKESKQMLDDHNIDMISAMPVVAGDDQIAALAPMSLTDGIVAALRTVRDPEIPVNIYDLGLIYRIDVHERAIEIDMTLTAPGCPVAGEMVSWVQ